MLKQGHRHLAYLVKLWQVRSEGKSVWRASLEDAYTGEKRGFGDPMDLFAFLQDKIGLTPSRVKGDESGEANVPDGSNRVSDLSI